MPRVSVVIPVYDEEESIETLHRELDAALAPVAGGVEIVFIDDGSRDRSLERLRAIAAKDARVRVVELDGNQGQTAAFAAGFAAAAGDVIVTLDADLQNDPADIPRLLAHMDAMGADVVNGVRTARRDSWVRLASSRSATRARNGRTNASRAVSAGRSVARRARSPARDAAAVATVFPHAAASMSDTASSGCHCSVHSS